MPVSRLDVNQAAALENVIITNERIQSRFGTSAYGASFTATPMLVVNFITSGGISYVVRFDTDKIWNWNGSTWDEITGAGPFTGGTTDMWTFTGWNDTLIVSNNKDGTYTVDPEALTVTAIAAAPLAKHLTTWAGRVIATATTESSVVYSNRIRWSVKLDSTNWSGTGSGYEDLLATPGGILDPVHGFFPITDTTAMIVRVDSVWQVNLTGNADAPFQFNRLYDKLGCRAVRSIVSVPDGVVYHGTDGVYHVTMSGWKNIGASIRKELVTNLYDTSISYAIYNPQRNVYIIAVADDNSGAPNHTWEYDFATQGWTKQVYPFNIRSLGLTLYSVSGAIDDLTGTIDALYGPIDSLGQVDTGQGMFLVPSDTTSYVVLADADTYTDVAIGSNTVTVLLTTGRINTPNPLKRTQIIECQLEYEAATAQTLFFDYLEDGSTTYTNFASASITTTTAPTTLRINKTLDRSFIRLQIRSSTLGKLTVIAFHVFAVEGGMINP